MTDSVELILDAQAALGEGPIWHAPTQRLYWVNIAHGEVHVYDARANTDRTIQVGQPVGTVVPRRSGGVMLAVKAGFASLDLETEKLTVVRWHMTSSAPKGYTCHIQAIRLSSCR